MLEKTWKPWIRSEYDLPRRLQDLDMIGMCVERFPLRHTELNKMITGTWCPMTVRIMFPGTEGCLEKEKSARVNR